MAVMNSPFSSAAQTGNLVLDVGAALEAPFVKNALAKRIVDEADVLRVLALEPSPRNRTLLTLLGEVSTHRLRYAYVNQILCAPLHPVQASRCYDSPLTTRC
ncbi:hypothetical protein [Methylobacterium sp. AMS5]|uniref:hypothetical protein n=1 Tax=Methylobacterium sp. AMS5 TaxID=925818 RepID=UPI00074F990C|nr:hypothetical protein [Methylobacterium sp. AMS5]AMB47604.1 hypothetical protein Y590_21875 [Methylobacterium sp. AMS5]